MNRHRIDLLDSFRFLAIISVLLYHFTCRYSSQVPVGSGYRDIFKYGYLGVNFFFVISGFVISYTLENTPSLASFCKNRFVRLFPPLLLCTVLTFWLASTLDKDGLFPNARQAKDFLPSLTMINPNIWKEMTGRNFSWINGSYWSLWVELQFYVLVSGIYFLDKKHFIRNFLLASIALSIVKYIPGFLLNSHWRNILPPRAITLVAAWSYADELFNLVFYILWFTLGVIFYHLYKRRSLRENRASFREDRFLFLYIALALCMLYGDRFVYSGWVLHVVVAGLFLLMIYKKEYLVFLHHPLMRRIGMISYSIYLIHEVIGVILMSRMSSMIPSPALRALLPFLVIGAAVLFAELSYRFYEKKAAVFISRALSGYC
jgi:peptidoglycan/LPS O-acetylase OafA/YrhL